MKVEFWDKGITKRGLFPGKVMARNLSLESFPIQQDRLFGIAALS